MQISNIHRIQESKTNYKFLASFFVELNIHDLFGHYSLTRKAVEPNSSCTSETGNALTESSYSKMKKKKKKVLVNRKKHASA